MPYIPQVIPSMIKVIRSIIKEIDVKYQHQPVSEAKYREVDNLLRQLGTLISIVRQHIRNSVGSIPN